MNKKYIIPGIISALAFAGSFLMYCYMDLTSLTVWTLNIWDTLFTTGNIRDFYSYSAMNLYGLQHAMVGSDILIYIPWAIWNLPIWLLQHFAGVDAAYHMAPQIWSKLFLLIVFAGCIYPVKKIAKKLSDNREETFRAVFLSATSLFTITSLAYIGQNDVEVILPFLMSISCLLDDNKKGFVLWAALSIAFKPFFIFSYIGMVLLKEKNLIKISGYVLAAFSVFVLQKLPFIGAPLYSESLSYGPTGGAIKLLFANVIDVPPAGASIFAIALLVVYIGAYFNDKQIGDNDIIYMAVSPMVILFMFTRYESYRPFYLVPVLFLLMMTKPEFNRINLLLETVASASLMAFYMLDDILYFNPGYLYGSAWRTSVAELAMDYLPAYGFALLTAVFVVCMTGILVINHPRFTSENKVLLMKEEPWIMSARSIIYAVPFLFSLVIRIIM